MKKSIAIIAGSIVLSIPVVGLSEVILNGIKIRNDGKIEFTDSSTQGTAMVKGDQGPQGPKGDPGTPGSQVTKDAMCQVYANSNLPPAPFCENKIIFVTSQLFNGNLGGLEGADQKCQNAATLAGLTGTYKAWLSDSTYSAKDRLSHSPAPYIRTDGTIIAMHWLDLLDGWIKDPIICDEFKNCFEFLTDDINVIKSVWTNTYTYGSKLSNHCDNWSSSSDLIIGGCGKLEQINNLWTFIATANCDGTRRLYCIQQ